MSAMSHALYGQSFVFFCFLFFVLFLLREEGGTVTRETGEGIGAIRLEA
jgi:hypothetical protein